MGLDVISMRMIRPHLAGASVLCLGYPDIQCPPDMVKDALGVEPTTFVEPPTINKQTFKYAETISTLKLAGAKSVDVVDLIAHKKIERIVDLNVPQAWPRRYRLVINPGTLEHCFNLGQAWANAWNAMEFEGLLMQVAPVTMLNHGFWNINPIACSDWCAANGGRVRQLVFGRNGSAADVTPKKIDDSDSGRGYLPEETVMYAMMQKLRDALPVWPTQGIYRQ